MAWVAVDKDGEESIFNGKPYRVSDFWQYPYEDYVILPKGSIKKLTGKDLTWDDEPIELKEVQNCEHDYSNGNGVGFHVCRKCGDSY